MTTADFQEGQAVEVHSFGRWYTGIVASVGRTRLKVAYATGTGTRRVKAFPLSHVRATCSKCDPGIGHNEAVTP